MPDYNQLVKELVYTVARSSGKGGQNVNKVNTKVELFFDVNRSFLLTDEEKQMILSKAANKISNEGVLHISCQAARSQLENKENAVEKFKKLIASCLAVKKKRKATKPTKSSKQERVDTKKRRSAIKNLRQRIGE